MAEDVIVKIDGADVPDITDVNEKVENVETIEIDGKSYNLNENGDAINEDGSVFKSKTDLESKPDDDVAVTEVEIYDEASKKTVTYKLDKDGNAIDDKGEIMYSKEELEALGEESTTELDVNSLIDKVGIKVYNEKGEVINYDNTEDSQISYIRDVHEVGKQIGANEYYEHLVSTYPFMNDLLLHLNSGGKFEDFKEEVDYSTIKLDKKNAEQLKQIITQAKSIKGDKPESIVKYLDFLSKSDSDNDSLLEQSKLELEYLLNRQVTNRVEKEKLIEANKLESIENAKKYWGINVDDKGNLVDLKINNSVYSIINSGKIKVNNETYVIPEKIKVVDNGKANIYTRNDFFRYLYEPVVYQLEDGSSVQMTRDQYKIEVERGNRDLNHDIYDAFERFVNYDKTQFIKEQINNNTVNNVKKLVVKKHNVSTTVRKSDPIVKIN